ncbi:hypothetical protein DFH07DRAFT_983206 [Mycena maculata]|uniref:F-box domain-containing protein n=1 Tax=Mycena maculata TaxID=230809 RepID=A0AAD7K0Z2_9AGAR|nr:hypothetical protein DFH07DRAFT_983206 [Mycena maculata]
MVSADNVNLDVLEIIFSHLSGNDLASIALVSRSFFAGVIPRLYQTLLFRLSHAKRYPAVMSPFAAVSAHPEFAIHVRHVDIRTVPSVKSQYNPKFLLECTRALDLCRNITSFRCSVNALPPFIGALQKKDRLRDLRIYANLTTDQALKMAKLDKIRHLTLDFASWNVMNLLPRWAGVLKDNLTTLTLFMANELNETVLGAALAELPNLLGLHVVGCAKVDHVAVLALVPHTPNLDSLSMSTGDTHRVLPLPSPSLPNLRHLALDHRPSPAPAPFPAAAPNASTAVLVYLAAADPPPALTSFVLKSKSADLLRALVVQLTAAHAGTLRHLAFLDCAPSVPDAVAPLARACVALERLEVAVPVRDLELFAAALSPSRTLRTLIDAEAHSMHGPHPSLTGDGVRLLLGEVPSLRTVVSDGRKWTVSALSILLFTLRYFPLSFFNSTRFLFFNSTRFSFLFFIAFC